MSGRRVLGALVVSLMVWTMGCGDEPDNQDPNQNGEPTNQDPNQGPNQDPDDGWDQDFLQIADIVRATCAVGACHGEPMGSGTDLGFGANQESLELEAIIEVFQNYESPAGPLVDPGNPENSQLYVTLTLDDPVLRMPQAPLPPLPDAQIELVRSWIEAGANYE